MIPKIIHYCWFGRGEKPRLIKKCIDSWVKYCPDYKIIEWNEDNFDIKTTEYTRFCYENKQFAFLSDYVRLYVVEKMGGIYFDTDVELVRRPDSLLTFKAYFGFESDRFVNTGIGFGSEPHHPVLIEMLEEYNNRKDIVYKEDFVKNHKMTGSPTMNTKPLVRLGLIRNGELQCINSAAILPVDFLCPLNDITGEMRKTGNTVSIHWYYKSANKKGARLRSSITRPIHRIINIIKK